MYFNGLKNDTVISIANLKFTLETSTSKFT